MYSKDILKKNNPWGEEASNIRSLQIILSIMVPVSGTKCPITLNNEAEGLILQCEGKYKNQSQQERPFKMCLPTCLNSEAIQFGERGEAQI